MLGNGPVTALRRRSLGVVGLSLIVFPCNRRTGGLRIRAFGHGGKADRGIENRRGPCVGRRSARILLNLKTVIRLCPGPGRLLGARRQRKNRREGGEARCFQSTAVRHGLTRSRLNQDFNAAIDFGIGIFGILQTAIGKAGHLHYAVFRHTPAHQHEEGGVGARH